LQEQMEIASRYQAGGTPMGYLVDEKGRIASSLAVGADALLALADPEAAAAAIAAAQAAAGDNGHAPKVGNRSLAESKINRSGRELGTPAPDFRLPRVEGGQLALKEYRGKKVLLVFSSLSCGPCDELLPRLAERARRADGVQVLMVGRGDAEQNRAKAAQHG